MDFRAYNIMMLEARQAAQKAIDSFNRRFYSREIGAANRNLSALQEYQQVISQEAPPMTPIPQIPEPMLGEEDNV